MSISALLKAVRNTLRAEMDLEDATCRIMPGPKPPPSCGQRFFSVYAADWVAGDYDLNLGLDESYGIAVALTFRAGFAPYDDHGEELYIQNLESMENMIRNMIVLLDKSIDIMTQANNFITGTYKIIEPLRFESVDAYPRYVDESWFLAQTTQSDPYCGLVQQLNLSGARRKQVTGSAE